MSILHWLDRNIEKVIIVAVTSAMVVVLLIQVFCRYVLNASISSAEEISIFGNVWLTYFGTSLAIVQRRHIRILVFSQWMSPVVNKIMDMVVNGIFFIFVLIVMYGTTKMAIIAFTTHQTAAASGIPIYIVIAGIPVAFVCCCLRLVQDTMRHYNDYRSLKSGGQIETYQTAINTEGESK